MQYKTNRLVVKPFSPEDETDAIAIFTSERVKKTYMLPDFSDQREAAALFNRLQKLSVTPERYVCGIYYDNPLIGLINETDVQTDTIELGYALHPDFWGNGFATEALTGAIDWLFCEGFSTVLCGAFSENRASMRVMEKSGMHLTAQQEEIEYRGKLHQCIYYSISKA